MGWLSLDDNFAEHRKVESLSDAAFRLHVAGMCMTARMQDDGVIYAAKVTRLVPRFRKTALQELIDRGLWIPHPDGYEIHDFLDWNLSRAQIEERRERKRAAGKKGADSRWH